MGKSQKKRSMRRHNPMRVPDSHLPKGLASAESTSSKSQSVVPIIQKMESPDSTERKWACVAVSNLIQNDPSTRRLLQGRNVVGALITRLSDGEEDVVVEAAGSLRNLCIDGGYEICAEMYNKGILSPLRTYIPKISSILSQYLNSSPKDAPENTKTLVFQLAEHLITILWCLSETSNKALRAINEINMVPFLMSFLAARDKLALGSVLAAAQCLYVLTDDNPPAIAEVKADAAYLSTLLTILNDQVSQTTKSKDNKGKSAQKMPEDTRLASFQVLAAGTLRNCSPLPAVSIAAWPNLDHDLILPVLLPIVNSISLPEVASSIQNLVANLQSEPQQLKPPTSKNGPPKPDHRTDAEKELERLESALRTTQLALEILTDVNAMLPELEEHYSGTDEEDIEEQDDDVDDHNDPIEVERAQNEQEDAMNVDEAETAATGPNGRDQRTPLPPLVFALLELIQPTALSFPPLASPSIHPPTTSALSAVHIAALECLNNIFLSLAVGSKLQFDLEDGTKVWKSIWQALELVGTETGPGQERRLDYWAMAVGVLWGVGGVWKGRFIPEPGQVQILFQLFNATQDETLRVKCVGVLECLAQHPESIAMNKEICDFFFNLLGEGSTSFGTEPLVQAVSALIDIFSDESMPYDVNFKSGGYLNKLIDGVDNLKRALKGIDRKSEGGQELRKRADETRQNLRDFIQYRRALR